MNLEQWVGLLAIIDAALVCFAWKEKGEDWVVSKIKYAFVVGLMIGVCIVISKT